MIKVEKVSFKTLKKLTLQQRIQAIQDPNYGQMLVSALTPTELALLFPRRYLSSIPDISGFMKAVPSGVTQARQRYYDQQIANTARATPQALEGKPGGWLERFRSKMTAGVEKAPALTGEQSKIIDQIRTGSISADDPKAAFLKDIPEDKLKEYKIEAVKDESGNKIYKGLPIEITEEAVRERLAVEAGVVGKHAALKELIAKKEHGVTGDAAYDVTFGSGKGRYPPSPKPVTQMTIAEILDYQQRSKAQVGSDAFPVGKYQFVRSTLERLVRENNIDPKTTVLSKELQEKFGNQLIEGRGGNPRGLMSEWDGLKRFSSDREITAALEMDKNAPAIDPKLTDQEKYAKMFEIMQKETDAKIKKQMAEFLQKNAPQSVAAAVGQHGATSVVEKQQEVAGVRRLPIKEDLKMYLGYASERSGVGFEITSGGQTGAKGSATHTGSYRHNVDIPGTIGAADGRMFVIEDGKKRYLSIDNPADIPTIKKFTKAFAEVAPSAGVGTDYMAVGTPSQKQLFHFGGGNRPGDAPVAYQGPEWFRESHHEGIREQGSKEAIARFESWKQQKIEQAEKKSKPAADSVPTVIEASTEDQTNIQRDIYESKTNPFLKAQKALRESVEKQQPPPEAKPQAEQQQPPTEPLTGSVDVGPPVSTEAKPPLTKEEVDKRTDVVKEQKQDNNQVTPPAASSTTHVATEQQVAPPAASTPAASSTTHVATEQQVTPPAASSTTPVKIEPSLTTEDLDKQSIDNKKQQKRKEQEIKQEIEREKMEAEKQAAIESRPKSFVDRMISELSPISTAMAAPVNAVTLGSAPQPAPTVEEVTATATTPITPSAITPSAPTPTTPRSEATPTTPRSAPTPTTPRSEATPTTPKFEGSVTTPTTTTTTTTTPTTTTTTSTPAASVTPTSSTPKSEPVTTTTASVTPTSSTPKSEPVTTTAASVTPTTSAPISKSQPVNTTTASVTPSKPPEIPAKSTGGKVDVQSEQLVAKPIGDKGSDNTVVVDQNSQPVFTMDTKKEAAVFDPIQQKVDIIPTQKTDGSILNDISSHVQQNQAPDISQQLTDLADRLKGEFENLLSDQDKQRPQQIARTITDRDPNMIGDLTQITSSPYKTPSSQRAFYRARFNETGEPVNDFHHQLSTSSVV